VQAFKLSRRLGLDRLRPVAKKLLALP